MIGSRPPAGAALPAPSMRRRLACMLYEAVLLFGVVAVAGLAYGMLTDQRHALQGNTGLQVFLFIVLGVYFAGLWSSSGQTLAMKTWRIRLVSRDGHRNLAPKAALLRFIAALLLVPTLLGMLWALVDRDRQFLHDRLAGSLLIPAD